MGATYMDGNTFLKEFLQEDTKDILNAQYVLVSSRIRKTGSHKNVMNCANTLYPSPEVLMGITDFPLEKVEKKEIKVVFEREYRKQLKSQLPLLASIIKAMIVDDMVVIFLCSKKERKLHYLEILANVIYENFGYLMIEYEKTGDIFVAKQDIAECYKEKRTLKILKKADKILSDAKEREESRKRRYMLRTEKGRKKLLKSMKKSELKAQVKKQGFYRKGMTRSEMIEIIELRWM